MPFGIDDALTIGGGLLGATGGLFGGGQSRPTSQYSSYNNTQTNTPWAGIQPYFMGGDGTPGIWPSAAANYSNSAWTPAMQDTAMNWFNDTSNSRNIARDSGWQNVGAQLVGGQYDSHITPASAITAPAALNPRATDPVTARATQGELDPTAALQSFLKGDQSNPWIGQQQKAITDSMTRNFNENILPGIRQTAIADGQYGGSRGDIANTLAVSRLNTDLAPALSQLASGAYENEQQRKYGVANALNDQAGNFAQANANRELQAGTTNASNLLQTQQFNTGTQLNNNAQNMQAEAQRVGNLGAGLNFAQGVNGLLNADYSTMLQALGLPAAYDTQQLQNYAGLLYPALAFQTTTGSGSSNSFGMQPTNYNPAASALSGARAGVGLARSLLGTPGGR